MVPKTMLKEWATTTFQSATDYWTFRKMFTLIKNCKFDSLEIFSLQIKYLLRYEIL